MEQKTREMSKEGKTLEELLQEEEARKKAAGVDPQPDPEPEPDPDPTPDPDPEPNPDPDPQPDPEPDPEPQPEPDPNPEPEPTGKKSFIDLLKGDPDPKPESTPEPELSEEIKQKLALAEQIETNPLYKALALGADQDQIRKIAAEIAGADYSKMTYEDLIRMDIQAETNLEGDELNEEVEIMVAEHEAKSKYLQSREEKILKEKFASTGIQSPTLKALEEEFTKRGPAPDIKAISAEVAKQEKALILEQGKRFVGSDLYGVEFTEAELAEIVNKNYNVDAVAPYVQPNGVLNASQFIFDTFRLRNFEKMVEAEAARRATQVKKENVVTKKPTSGTPPMPKTIDPKKEVAKGLGLPDYVVKDMKFDN